MENIIQHILTIVSGLAVVIPLVIKLVEYVQKFIKEKNWTQLLSMVMDYMSEAEKNFSDGATRKEWVMTMVETSAKTLNYDLDMTVVSDLIDNLCSMSKSVNPPATEE